MKRFVCPKVKTDEEMKAKEGCWFEEKDLHVIVTESCDVYGMAREERSCCLNFGKKLSNQNSVILDSRTSRTLRNLRAPEERPQDPLTAKESIGPSVTWSIQRNGPPNI